METLNTNKTKILFIIRIRRREYIFDYSIEQTEVAIAFKYLGKTFRN